jgi:septal ring factor EnvC (AmiA/AmiB activator)
MSSKKWKRLKNMEEKEGYEAMENENPGALLSNEELISLVKEKIEEKNEVIKEQQMQIQDLQDKLANIEKENKDLKEGKKQREDLVKKISAILE